MKKIVRRGDIYWVHCPLDYVGSEQNKSRPGVVVSNDKNNQFSDNVEVCFLTTADKKYLPTHVQTNITGVASTILCESVYTVSKTRLQSYVASLPRQTLEAVDRALVVSLGLDAALPRQLETMQRRCAVLQTKQERYVKAQTELLKTLGGTATW